MKNKLGRIDILGLVIGSIIGWGAFTLPGEQFLPTSGVINTSIGLILGVVAISILQYAYRIMLENHDEEGGEFTYAYDNLGPGHGFIVGWSLSLCYLSMIPLNASAYTLILKEILPFSIQFGYLYSIGANPVYISDILLVSGVVMTFAYINIKGIKLSSRIQNIMSGLLVIIVISLTIFSYNKADLSTFYINYIKDTRICFSEISTVLAIVPFLFVGFDVVPQVSKDLQFKSSKASILTVLSIIIGAIIYACLNLIAALNFSPSKVSASHWAVAESISRNFGFVGLFFMIIALWAAVTGGINGFMIASSKLIAALGERKIMNTKYTERNKMGAYPKAIIFVSIVSLVAPWFGRQVILYIVDMASLLAAIAYTYVSWISFKKAKKIAALICVLAVCLSLLFIILLIRPKSPSFLGPISILYLIVRTLFGFWIYKTKKINV